MLVGVVFGAPILEGCFGFGCAECESSALVAVYGTRDGRYTVEASDGGASFRCEVDVRGEDCVTVAPCTSVHPSATGFGVFCPSPPLVSWTPGAAIAVTTSSFPATLSVRITDPDGRLVADRDVVMHYETRCGCPTALEAIDL